jgi:hypothetical protein
MRTPGDRLLHAVAILGAAIAVTLGVLMVVDGFGYGWVPIVVGLAFIAFRIYLIVRRDEPADDETGDERR